MIVYVVMYRKNAKEAYQVDSVWQSPQGAFNRYREIIESGDESVISDSTLQTGANRT